MDHFIYCPVANVAELEYPKGSGKFGHKHFSPGTKIYCFGFRWGDGGQRIYVVGKYRMCERYVKAVVPTKLLINWRLEKVYDPKVIEKMSDEWDDSDSSQRWANRLVERFGGIVDD